MSKWLSARILTVEEGDDAIEIDDDERVASADFEVPYIYLVVVKESPRRPEQSDGTPGGASDD